MPINRRELLTLGGLSVLGAAGLTVPFGGRADAKGISRLRAANFPSRYAVDLLRPPVLTPTTAADGVPFYDITARMGSARMVPGLTTPVYGYNGLVPGPVISCEKGVRVRVRIRNRLPSGGLWGSPFDISTHLHGSESLPQYDGYASDVTPVGYYKDYEYPNTQPARTLWYHDHGVHFTAQNAYAGLAAQYHLHDPVEREALPQGEFDVPLTVTDAIYDAAGGLVYDDNAHDGLWGDVILVNGRPWPRMKVKRRTYRFRILAASIARSYRWSLSPGLPLQVVATDGGLVPQGVAVSSFRHGGAERYEIVVDFSKVPAGTRTVELLNLSNKNNVDYDFTNKVMRFDVVDDPFDKGDPTWDRDYNGYPLASSPVMDAQPTGQEQVVKLRVQHDLTLWTINGRTWEDVIRSGFKDVVANPKVGEKQVWEIENRSGGWFHPVHIHLIDFKVLSRNGSAPSPWERGPKDVVYVGENETVRLLCDFDTPSARRGRYMVHCHNLPHEDHDMMLQFAVGDVDFDNDPQNPMTAAAAVPDPDYRA